MKYLCTRLVSVIMLWSIVTSQSQGDLKRLRQFNESLVVNPSSQVPLQEIIQNLTYGESVLVNVGFVNLTHPLIVAANNVTVRGRGSNETVLHCSEETRSALILRGYDIRIEGLTITGCKGESAVVVDGRNGTESTEVSVSFVEVEFVQSGRIESGVRGAGIRIEECLEESCTRPEVNIMRCLFEDNAAIVGGAIYGSNCVLRISDSRFVNNNALLSGGAVFLRGRSPVLELQSCTFTANRASNMSIPANSSLFDDSNQLDVASWKGGGAVFVESPSQLTVIDSNFVESTSSFAGGAIRLEVKGLNVQVESTVNVFFEGNTFYKNSVSSVIDIENGLQPRQLEPSSAGGALSVRSHTTAAFLFILQRSLFEQNTALGGGAVYLQSLVGTAHNIRSCRFLQNEADGLGGAILISDSFLRINGSGFVWNKARTGGGIFLMSRSSVIAGPDYATGNLTVFDYNIALNGGALQAMLQAMLIFEHVEFRHNIALRYGGALRAYGTQLPVILRGVLFENNTASIGGAVSTHSVLIFILDESNGVPTRIINNAALLGGGLYRQRGTITYEQMHIRNTVFKDNKASGFSNADIDRFFRVICHYPFFGRLIEETRRRIPVKLTTKNLYQQLTDAPCGHGGGFMIEAGDLNMYVIAEIVFENVILTGNEARVGGGGSLHVSLSFWNVEKRLHCFPPAYGVDSCQKLLFQNVTVTGNKAEYGGGLFVTRPEAVMLTCNRTIAGRNRTLLEVMKSRFHAQNTSQDFKDDLQCTDIHSNRISDGAPIGGADVGSAAASLHLENSDGILKTISSGERPALSCDENSDRECPRSLTVAVKDAFNRSISRGIADSSMEITVSSEHAFGQLRYTACNGTVTIKNTYAWGINIPTVRVKIHTSQNTSMQVIATFATRACTLGEHVHDSLCVPCHSEQYGFDGSRYMCESCPAHAVCKGGAALVPEKGYWHSTPFSPHFHPCFSPGACSYDHMTMKLTQFYKDKRQLKELLNQLKLFLAEEGSLPDFSGYEQCAEGYEGVLCGSCKPFYGRALSSECSKCPNRGISIFLGIVSFFSLFFIVGISAAITFASSKERISLVSHRLKEERRSKKREFKRSVNRIPSEIIIEERQPSHSSTGSSSARADPDSRKLLQERLLATVQLTELLKILLNHLQITSAALRIQVEWKTALNGLLLTEATFAGVTGDVFNAPFECHFDSDAVSHSSIAAFWGRILIPMAVLCSLIFIFSCIWIFLKQKESKRGTNTSGKGAVIRSWKTGVIIITIVAVYSFFIDVVRELLMTVNCSQVDEAISSESTRPYENFAIETEGSVWVQDTKVKCFKGAHIAVGIAGIFGLILAVAFIVLIILWLPLNRDSRKNEHFIARYWHLYQGYRMEWYTFGWEAIVLTRKALVAAVIVFSVHLGPSLQAALCCGILVTALMIQTVFKPFNEEEDAVHVPEYFSLVFDFIRLPSLAPRWRQLSTSISLNGLESASLFASITVFLFGVVLNDSRSSTIAEILLGGVTLVTNAFYLLFMLYRLYAGVHLVMDLKLEL